MNKKIRVGLFYGGKSGEHNVSLSTAKAVISEFNFEQYAVFPFYITKRGEWRAGAQLFAPVDDKQRLTFVDGAALEHSRSLDGPGAAGQVQVVAVPEVDVAFPLLHGTYGEDGTIQGMFEMLNIPYVGAGVLASAAGMDKVVMKKLFASAGLPQCVYHFFTRKQWETNRSFFVEEIEKSLGYPCFVKPVNLGSSVGISKACNREELIEAVREAFKYDRKVIVEEFVDAREIEVSVLGNDEPCASVPGEISSSGEFYDYQAKYTDGKSVITIPADIPPETAQQAQEMAVRAFRAIDGSGLSRVDFFLKREDGRLLVNEINTMPGYTPNSMYPLLWKESGLSYSELFGELIRLAIERHEEKQAIKYGMDD